MAKKNKILTIFLGMVVGVSLTLGGGLLAFKIYREYNKPKRFMVSLDLNNYHILSDGSLLYAASSLDRIFKDGNTLLKPTFSKNVDLSAARHEYEAFQVVVKAGQQPVKSAGLEISDLISKESSAILESKEIVWRVVGYVPTIEPYYKVKYVGDWPDPLMPAQKTDVNPGVTQPFWVSVYIPKNTPAGLYQGTIKFSAEGVNPQEIPLQVRVYDFTVPVAGSLKTAFDFYGHETFRRYPRGDKESDVGYQARLAALNDKFIIAMLKYRMNPVLNVDPTNNAQLAQVDKYLLYGLNNFSIGRRGGTLGNNWPNGDQAVEDLLGEYRTYGELLKLNKLLPYTYIYTWDEGDMGNPRVSKIASMIHRAYPGLKNMVCYHGLWDTDEGLDWIKDIDIWTFQIDNFVEEKMRKLQKVGKEIWMYISGPGGYGTPNLAMDFDSIDYRIIPWLCWKFDIRGFLYWCVNWWPTVDPFVSAQNSKWEQNGNGLLFYPGLDGPIPSLRLEIFRDGMEDYEYIQILLNKLKTLKKKDADTAAKKFIDDGIKLLTVDDSIASALDNFTKNGDALKERRDAIARKIEEFDRVFGSSEPAK